MSLTEHIAFQIYGNFAFEPTADQKKLIEALAQYLTSGDPEAVFLLNGYAGTGKTTVIGALVQTLARMEIPTVLMAPTGRAAKVMGQYACREAFTIHKKIYRERAAGRFELNYNKSNDTVFIIDEASMLTHSTSSEGATFGSGDLLEDLFTYIRNGNNNKIILVGDQAQLPPVHYDYSPALDPGYMTRYGNIWDFGLSEVVRHQSESGILANATQIREMIEAGYADIPLLETDFPDIIPIGGQDLIDELDTCYGRYGTAGTAIVTRSNKRANHYNQGIRRSVLYHEEEVSSGDMLMVVKNNYHYAEADPDAKMDFIANGDVARVRRIYNTEEKYGFRFALAELEFPDYDDYRMECRILLDVLYSEAPALTREQSNQLFEAVEREYAGIGQKPKRYKAVLSDEYFAALQVKFAYAFTAHKAQGGQWPAVFIDTMLFGQEPMTLDLLRWLYTAVTRATERLYLVNFDQRFFGDESPD